MNYNKMLNTKLTRKLRRGAIVCMICFSGAGFAGPAEDTTDATKLYQQGKLDQALSKVNGALTQQPKDAQGRFLKGLILTEQKKGSEAIQVFTGLTEDYPELPEPYNNLAVLYANQGNYDKAKAALELAIHTHPSYATAYENLGDIYAQLARRSYDKALQLDKTNATAQGKLSMVKDIFNLPKLASADPAKSAAIQVAKADPKAIPKIEPKVEPKSEPAKVEPAKAAPASVTKPAVTSPGNASAEVAATVAAWAKAWSAKDTKGYLGFYAPDFETPKGMTRAAWEAQRRERIEPKRSISVDAKILKTTLQGNVATVVFRQAYRADALKSDSTKTMVLVKTGDRWLIRSARDGG
jgi:tetratricopeptide (TPR) repeat protein